MVKKNRRVFASTVAFITAVALSVQVLAFSKGTQIEEFASKPAIQFATDFEQISFENIVTSIEAWVNRCISESRPDLNSGEFCVDPRYQTILEGLAFRKSRVECFNALALEVEPVIKQKLSKEHMIASLEVVSLFLGGSSAGVWAYKSRYALRAAGKELLKKGGLRFEENAGWLEFKHAMTGELIEKSVITTSRWKAAKKAFKEVSGNVEKATGKGMSWFYKTLFLLFVGDTVAGNLKSNPLGSLQNLFGFAMPGDPTQSIFNNQRRITETKNPLQGLDHIDPELSLQDYKMLVKGRDAEIQKVNSLFSELIKSAGDPEDDPFYDLNISASKRANHIFGLISTLQLMNIFEENVIYQWRNKVVDRCQSMAHSINQGIEIVKPARKK